MPFKETSRVIYNKNPLVQVVSQLRFPRILAIDEKQPVDFQEKLRQEYPLFEVSVVQSHNVVFDPVQQKLQDLDSANSVKNYVFTTENKEQTINLAGTSLSFVTSHYTKWEDFFSALQKPLQALNEIYKPTFFERVGLRYIDAFQRSSLKLDNYRWDELIEPTALCFLSDENVKNDVVSYSSVSEIKLTDNVTARVITALGYVVGKEQNKEPAFIVDTDLYFGRIEIANAEKALAELHNHSTKIIGAIIKEKLRDAMGPTKHDTSI
jgi:uncharacterized protein (TIGR04255 family)